MHVKALSLLLGNAAEVPAVLDMAIHGLTADSREVRRGDAFVALRGHAGDPWRYVDEAIGRGAACVLLETESETGCSEQGDALVVRVPDLHRRQAEIADRFYDSPSRALHVIGVTGTNGKSSVTRFLAAILNHAGLRTATLGTLGYGFPEALEEASHTTPDVIRVQRWLNRFREQGASAVVMEVSSHALDQGRVRQVEFEGAVYTNLSRDHLDYHGTMAEYGAAKAHLFTDANPRFAVINIDDAFGRELAQRVPSRCHVWRYSTTGEHALASVELQAQEVQLTETGFTARLATPVGALTLQSSLLGRFNLSNITAAAGATLALNIDLETVSQAVSEITAPPGRLQQFVGPDGVRAVVDYAHTPDALETALSALRPHVNGQLWCVFGCGGDRDPGKRALMAQVAERLADQLVLTDDNPRSEDPRRIVADVKSGLTDPERALVEHDRARAIAYALKQAGPEDLVLVAGKGHEAYQERQGKRSPFSDSETVQECLDRRANGRNGA